MAVWLRDPGLSLSIQSDGSFLARIPTRAVGAKLPPPALEILSFCAHPRGEEEVANRYGPLGLQLFRQLGEVGLLVEAEAALHTPVFFQNFGALDVHRRMLSDRVRLDAYAEALRRLVRPGMAVLDAGTGTGVLACLAAKAGARVVYAVDQADILEAARGVVEASGLGGVVKLLRGDFRSVSLPEPVDLVVTETFGAWALAEAGVEDLVETCRRHLAPGGKIIPESVELWWAPVKGTAVWEEALGSFSPYEGVHLEALRPTALSRGTTTTLSPEDLGAPGTMLCRLPLPCPIEASGTSRFEVEQTIHGLACWFHLHLGEGVDLSTAPHRPLTHWRQQFLPLRIEGEGPVELEARVRAAQEDRRGLEVEITWKRGSLQGEGWFRLR